MPEARLQRTRDAYRGLVLLVKGERVLTRVELARLADEIHEHASRRLWVAIADSTGHAD
jgi:hypothetical protein